MDQNDSDHFVATIKVERVRRKTNRDHGSANHGSVSRDVVETLNINLKAGSLDKLKEKVAAHVNLLDEEDL